MTLEPPVSDQEAESRQRRVPPVHGAVELAVQVEYHPRNVDRTFLVCAAGGGGAVLSPTPPHGWRAVHRARFPVAVLVNAVARANRLAPLNGAFFIVLGASYFVKYRKADVRAKHRDYWTAKT